MTVEQFPQSAGAAAVAPGDGTVLSGGFLDRTAYHFVGNGIGEQHHQIGAANLFFEISRHFGKNLGLVSELFADLPVLTLHTFITADDDNAHGNLLLYRLAYANWILS